MGSESIKYPLFQVKECLLVKGPNYAVALKILFT